MYLCSPSEARYIGRCCKIDKKLIREPCTRPYIHKTYMDGFVYSCLHCKGTYKNRQRRMLKIPSQSSITHFKFTKLEVFSKSDTNEYISNRIRLIYTYTVSLLTAIIWYCILALPNWIVHYSIHFISFHCPAILPCFTSRSTVICHPSSVICHQSSVTSVIIIMSSSTVYSVQYPVEKSVWSVGETRTVYPIDWCSKSEIYVLTSFQVRLLISYSTVLYVNIVNYFPHSFRMCLGKRW